MVLAVSIALALITIQAPVYFIALIPTTVFLSISIIAFIKAALKRTLQEVRWCCRGRRVRRE